MVKYPLFSLLFILLVSSCEGVFNIDMSGDGNRIEKSFDLEKYGEFGDINLTCDFEVHIRKAEERRIVIEADSNLIPYINYEVEGNELLVKKRDNFNILPSDPVIATLYLSDFDRLRISGGSRVKVYTFNTGTLRTFVAENSQVEFTSVKANTFYLLAEGGTMSYVNGVFEDIHIRQVGSGNVKLAGETNEGSLILEGSGIIDAVELMGDNSRIQLFGSGLIYCCFGNNELLTVDGTGRVYFCDDLFEE
ncbi:DUF2807 domain-containing protein [Marinilabiliaceae bacterium ANBcel2]|nr:DUF2807 domain-containing protein [Marinilabiliaceae bacterium ANBcel2]